MMTRIDRLGLPPRLCGGFVAGIGAGVGGRRCHALGRRRAQRRAADRGLAQPDGGSSARRRRDQAHARLAHLLALSRRFRRAAAVRLRGLAETSSRSTCCGRRRSALPKPAAPRSDIRRGVIFPLRIVPQDAGKPVVAAAQARLCDLREAVRAGGRARRADAWRAAARRRMPRWRPPRRGCRRS